MKKIGSRSGVLQISSWPDVYSSSTRRFLIIQNEHEVGTSIRPPPGKQKQRERGRTDRLLGYAR